MVGIKQQLRHNNKGNNNKRNSDIDSGFAIGFQVCKLNNKKHKTSSGKHNICCSPQVVQMSKYKS